MCFAKCSVSKTNHLHPYATFRALLARLQRYKKSRNIAPSGPQMRGYSAKTGVETAVGGALRGRKQEKIKKNRAEICTIRKIISIFALAIGEMPEWSIGPHSKCGERATVPGVRIPLFPRKEAYKKLIFNLIGFSMSQKMHQKCTNPCFYTLLRRFSNSHIPYNLSHFLALPDTKCGV